MSKELDLNIIENVLRKRADPFAVLETTRFVVENADFVTINPEMIKQLADQVSTKISRDDVLTEEQFGKRTLTPQKVFIEDVVNYCFWTVPGKEKWNVDYPLGHKSDGWDALVACFDRAIDEGIPILDASFLANVTDKDVAHIFRGENSTEIPLLDKRLEFLKEAGRALTDEFDGMVDNMIKRTNNNAPSIVEEVLQWFPSFNDVSHFRGQEVSFLKRAQIVAYDISLLPDIDLKNTDQLTIFADYKLPQILRGFGIVEYRQDLAKKVDSYTILGKDSPEEVEVRASTIWACEIMAYEIRQQPVLVDNALWHLSQDMEENLAPYHRVLTPYY